MLALCLATTVAGCDWSHLGFGPQNTNFNPESELTESSAARRGRRCAHNAYIHLSHVGWHAEPGGRVFGGEGLAANPGHTVYAESFVEATDPANSAARLTGFTDFGRLDGLGVFRIDPATGVVS